jgi:predicted HicB family RNase H-like nuclease
MSSFLKYKNYLGTVEYSEEDNLLCGEVVGIKDLIMYHGHSLEDLKRDFEESLDFYLETCAAEGFEPNKTSYVNVDLQLPPELRRRLISFTTERDKPLNEAVEEAIRMYISA